VASYLLPYSQLAVWEECEMDRDARVSPRTGMMIKLALTYVLWIGIFALIKLTLIVFSEVL